MANVLVYIELRHKQASRASLCVLNAGRAVASSMGATLYALLPCTAPPSYGDDDIIAVLSRHGADKVILVTGPDLDEVAVHATHGEAIRAACTQFRPRLVLMPASPAGRDIGPRLAIQLAARYLSDVELSPAGESEPDFHLSGLTFRRRFRCTESIREMVHPVVATITTRGEPRTLGDDEAEVVMLHSPARDPAAPRLEARATLASPARLGARLVLAGGAGLGTAERFAKLQQLAGALGGAALASTTACSRQLAAPELCEPGCVDPEVYLTFGVSGSEQHLAWLPPGTRILAVNTDPAAPIRKVAEKTLIADAGQTIEELLAALQEREP